MLTSALEGLAKLSAERRRLFAKYGGYPSGSTHLLVVLSSERSFPLMLFGGGHRPEVGDEIFDPTWALTGPARPLYGGKASLGMGVEGDGGASTGSLGWNIMFNGHDALVTCRHVAIADYSSRTPPDLMSVSSAPAGSAEVVWSPLMQSTTPAAFDIAIGEYINGEGHRKSNCGGTAGYPTTFATDLDSSVDRFEFAGVGICGHGPLVAVADVLTNYNGYQGGSIWLQNQLIFDMPVEPGHSGSLVKRSADNAVAGLNCAKSPHHGFAVANPLFLIDWDVTPGGPTDLPTVTLRNPPREDESWRAPQPTVEYLERDSVTSMRKEVLSRDDSSVRKDSIARLEWMLAAR